jgi:hypothetical protein
MQMHINQQRAGDGVTRLDPLRTDRTVTSDDSEVAASTAVGDDEPVVLGPEKARAASTNRMPARVLLISITLVVVAFLIGYLLVR